MLGVDLQRSAVLFVGCSHNCCIVPQIIVDAANAFGKDFAVVPCCVFPELFPHRFLTPTTDGPRTPVVSTEDFIVYLKHKAATNGAHSSTESRGCVVGTDTLGFAGRRVVVFRASTDVK